eukprot:997357-Pleurochrysis_carterae.AAC.1
MDRGQMLPCDFELWARRPADAVDELMRRRDYFWNKLSQEERHRTVYNAIQFESVGGDLHSEDALGSAS